MARQTPLDPAVVEEWLAAWNESDIFSDAAVLHLRSLITDPVLIRSGEQARQMGACRVRRLGRRGNASMLDQMNVRRLPGRRQTHDMRKSQSDDSAARTSISQLYT
jgi:hypothetical protein